MSRRLRVLVVAIFILGMTWAAKAQTPRPERVKIDVSRLGPQVGEQIPDFSLKDQAGKTWTRSSIMGPKGAMLVFVRSADW
ncbi:peroxiredoxin family protein [Acidobacteria bacterium AH-259-D05]|nr:peroxiredoxin family protein [Acidobacteria bacterium AH-259-D05]